MVKIKDWCKRLPSWKYILQRLCYLLLFVTIAWILISPQIIHHALILGVDSDFHFNQFYEAMKQIQTRHFSYFQSLFGFGASGKITNAVYAPFLAYLNGWFLLQCKSWISFQIYTSIAQIAIGGFLMFVLCKHYHATSFLSTIAGVLYMTSFVVSTWVIQQQATGWGAAVMPLIILYSIPILQKGYIKTIPLAFTLALLTQIHLMSALLALLTLLPIFAIGFFRSHKKGYYTLRLICCGIFTLLLTSNLWSTILTLFNTNHIVPVFPQQQLLNNALNWHGLWYFNYGLGVSLTAITLMSLFLLIKHWRRISFIIKALMMIGIIFLYASSALFPWQWLRKVYPPFTNLIQFPRRLLVIPIVLILFCGSQLCTYFPSALINTQFKYHSSSARYLTLIFTILVIFLPSYHVYSQINQDSQKFNSTAIFNEPTIWLRQSTHSPAKLKYYITNHNKGIMIHNIQKATPDYLPSNTNIRNDQDYYQLHPYYWCRKSYLTKNVKEISKKIIGNNTLQATVRTKPHKLIQVPLAVYQQSKVKINHDVVTHPQINQVGALMFKPVQRINRIQITFYPTFGMKFALAITITCWLLGAVLLFIKL